MNKLVSALIFTSIVSMVFSQNYNALPVIDVFVESLCPDCVDFITGSFKSFHASPDHEQLAVVNFYPFGNAYEKWDGQRWQFTCQHGPNECFGNAVETCGLNKMSKNEGHEFLICIEENIARLSKDFTKALEYCVDDESLRNDILNCANSDEGNQLVHEVAQKTPKHNYVPWVVFNGTHDVDAENQILTNMHDYLCKLQGYNSEACQQKVTVRFSGHLMETKVCVNNFIHYHSENENLKFLN